MPALLKQTGLRLIFICCCMQCINLYSQDGKWSVGIGFSPDLCFRRLQSEKNGNYNQVVIDSRNRNEFFKSGYHAGVYIKKEVNRFLDLETGLMYTNKGYKESSALRFGDQINPTMGFVSVTTFRHYKYFGIPLKANFKLVSLDKIKLHVTAGASISAFLEQKNVQVADGVEGYNRKTYYGDDFNQNSAIDVSPFLGLGVDIRLSGRMRLQVEPMYQYGILAANSEGSIHMHLWTAGINMALYYKL